MSTLLEILKYTVPSLVVILAIYFFFRSYLEQEQKRMILGIKKDNSKITLPIILQAYERLTLFLERISPNNLIPRINQPGMTAFDLQTQLVQTIREEFAHNLSQQIYISDKSWEMVKNAKEESMLMVNNAAAQLGKEANSNELAKAILTQWAEGEVNTTALTLIQLKREVSTNF